MKVLAVLNGKKFDGIREIPDEEFKEMQKHIQTLLTFQNDYERLTIVAKSLRSYEDPIATFLRNEITYAELKDAIPERLLNFVATFRSFLDHWETYLKRTYGKARGTLKRCLLFLECRKIFYMPSTQAKLGIDILHYIKICSTV